jgi:hypothetical protein
VSPSPVVRGAAGFALVVLSLTVARPVAAAGMVTPHALSAYDGGVVQRAAQAARERLRAPGCEAVVDEFKDDDGRTLREVLEGQGSTIALRLDAIRFVDASESSLCRSSQTIAFAVRKSPLVYVCPRTMEKTQLRQPGRVQAVVIHELLHTIGLGENPPTSTYITSRVEARCLSTN